MAFGDPGQLSPSAVTIPAAELRDGTILDDAATMDSEVRCVIPSLDPNLATDPMPWMPRGSLLPRRGDRAVIGMPPDGPPVILVWFRAAVALHLYPADSLYPADDLYPA